MNCDNIYCVYQNKGKCTLECIQIDVSGKCTECVYVDLDDKVLNNAKNKLLRAFEKDY